LLAKPRSAAVVNLPARVCAADKVEHLAQPNSSKTIALALVVQPRYEALQDAEGRQSAKRQQAEAGGVERIGVRVGFAAVLGREARCY
jgi:hypothetical protein